MATKNSKTILFITGAFVSNTIWEEWRAYFENRGYNTIAPPWPYKDASVEILRKRHPDPDVASIRLNQLVAHYEAAAKSLPEKPIIIGHSIGGLVGQILMQSGVAASVVAIHSVPPQGIFTLNPSFLRAGWGALGFFTSVKKTYMMTFRQWQFAFTNHMPIACQEDGYERFAIPESKLVVRDTTTSAAKVDFSKPHVPLLFIAGSADHAIPASLNLSNYKRYSHRDSVTDYMVFPDRNHFVLSQPGWQEVALYITAWLSKF
ncbi:MAG: alpha/beta hydrolase [Flavobacterium sp.]